MMASATATAAATRGMTSSTSWHRVGGGRVVEAPPSSSSSFAAKALFLRFCCRNPHSIDDSVTIAMASSNPMTIRSLGSKFSRRHGSSTNNEAEDDDDDLETALHSAIRYGASDKVLRALIELDSCDNQDQNSNNGTPAVATADGINGDLPLHTAIRHEASPLIVRLLLESFPTSLVVGNSDSETPLCIASRCQRYDLVTLLLGQAARMPGGEAMLKEVLFRQKDRWNCNPMEALWTSYLDNENEEDEHIAQDPNETEGTPRRRRCRGRKRSLVIAALCRMYSTNSLVSQEQSTDENDEVEPFEVAESMIQLIAAATSGSGVEDASLLVRSILWLGPDICPPSFLSVVIRACPEVLRMADNDEGQLPLHVAAAMGQRCCSNSRDSLKNTRGEQVVASYVRSYNDETDHWQDDHVLSKEGKDIMNNGESLNNGAFHRQSCLDWNENFNEDEDEDILALGAVQGSDNDASSRDARGEGRSRSRSPLSPWELFGGEDVGGEGESLEPTPKPSHVMLTHKPAGLVESTLVISDDYENSKKSMLQIVLDADPSCARLVDSKGRLPFHLALGMPWGPALKQLFCAYPEAISRADPVTGLYPFAIAAASATTATAREKNDCKVQFDDDDDDASLPIAVLDSSYQLLRQCPNVLLSFLPQKATRKRVSGESPSGGVHKKQRRLCPRGCFARNADKK